MPSPADIRSSRLSLGLTQAQAGELVGAARRTWQNWELGVVPMPSAKWELFRIKTGGVNNAKAKADE